MTVPGDHALTPGTPGTLPGENVNCTPALLDYAPPAPRRRWGLLAFHMVGLLLCTMWIIACLLMALVNLFGSFDGGARNPFSLQLTFPLLLLALPGIWAFRLIVRGLQ